MENRFGLKDFILCVLLVVIIISQWLSMKQADRQWTEVKRLAEQIDAQTTDLTFIRQQLAEGIAVNPNQAHSPPPPDNTTDPTATTLADPFDRVLAAQQMEGYTAGDWFVDAFSAQPPNLTPLISSDAYASIIQNRVVESLAID